jgi:hypothetical protein
MLDLPALVIHGAADPLVDMSGGRATAEAIPGAELVLWRVWATTCRARDRLSSPPSSRKSCSGANRDARSSDGTLPIAFGTYRAHLDGMRILIALARSEYAEIVLEHGLDQAARHPDAEIHVVSAAEDEDVEATRAFIEPLVRDGIDGHVLEPQCRACREVRRATNAEVMFCEEHAGDRLLDLTRLPTEATGTGIW